MSPRMSLSQSAALRGRLKRHNPVPRGFDPMEVPTRGPSGPIETLNRRHRLPEVSPKARSGGPDTGSAEGRDGVPTYGGPAGPMRRMWSWIFGLSPSVLRRGWGLKGSDSGRCGHNFRLPFRKAERLWAERWSSFATPRRHLSALHVSALPARSCLLIHPRAGSAGRRSAARRGRERLGGGSGQSPNLRRLRRRWRLGWAD
jgi:hypothetical protein